MIHTNQSHLPGQAHFARRADVFVIGTDQAGNQIVKRPWLAAAMDVGTRTIVDCKVTFPTGTNPKNSTE